MITLLSPAKSLNYDAPDQSHELTDHIFRKETMQLVRLMKKINAPDLKKMMHISDALTSLNVQRYKEFSKEYIDGNSRAAIEVFNGGVYQGLDYPTLENSDTKWAQNHVRILSGLYGILRPLDRMQPYRLEMSTKLENTQGNNLYVFWGSKISKSINKELKEMESDLIVNLASKEYFKSIDRKALNANIIDVVFKEDRGGELKFISFNAKKARGMMARYIIKHRVCSYDGLLGFDSDGYCLRDEESTESTLLFVR